ncbi:MAG: hypothetical protein V7604_1623 [Hyphomicrobiales bacterium]|jgi:hypothetical protein
MAELVFLYLIIQLVLYGPVLVALIFAVKLLNTGHRAAGFLLLALAAAPFGIYAVDFIHSKLQVPARDAEVASWRRTKITQQNRPTILVTQASWGIARSLVESGLFQKAYAKWDRDDWIVYERRPNPDCPTPYNLLKNWYDNDRLAETPCITAAWSAEPELMEPHLRLLPDRYAPSHYAFGEGNSVVSGSTLELRLRVDGRDELVAYWEIPYFKVLAFPPQVGSGWVREVYAPRQFEKKPDPRTFVLDAIGSLN